MKLATIAALIASSLHMPHMAVAAPQQPLPQLAGFPTRSRGHGLGLHGNKHARSSFKQNKRRGL